VNAAKATACSLNASALLPSIASTGAAACGNCGRNNAITRA
jgi:hypothetical protein